MAIAGVEAMKIMQRCEHKKIETRPRPCLAICLLLRSRC
jgi:hypothetical protein